METSATPLIRKQKCKKLPRETNLALFTMIKNKEYYEKCKN
jgi:hypothetical protein